MPTERTKTTTADSQGFYSGQDVLRAQAVVFASPGNAVLQTLELNQPEDTDLVVDVCFSGISTGTERLLFDGRMPAFPGMGYPLVPGYETIGHVKHAGKASGYTEGDLVFVPGARCYTDMRSLFGGAASRLVVPAERTFSISDSLGEKGLLLALAATAHHILHVDGSRVTPDLIVGHGVLGRLLARLSVVLSPDTPPVVWESNESRVAGAEGYSVVTPEDDERNDYQCIADVSGDKDILDILIPRLASPKQVSSKQLTAAPRIVLGGFYPESLSFKFAPAFMREATIKVAAEWSAEDMQAVCALANDGELSLDGLITHRAPHDCVQGAYDTAFNDSSCLKMILDWRNNKHG